MTEINSNAEKSSESASANGEIKTEAAKLFNLLGSAVSITFQEITNRLPMYMDPETRYHLDQLVEHDVAQDRQEAVKFLIAEGVKANRSLFDKIEYANTQIKSLRTQFRTLDFESETS